MSAGLCKNGHIKNELNTYISPAGNNECRPCRALAATRFRKLHNPSQTITIDNHRFGGNREKTIQRDKECCINCGMSREEHRKVFGRDITVDHIDGNGRNTPKQNRNNDLDNLQTLCLTCHGTKDVQRRPDVIKANERKTK